MKRRTIRLSWSGLQVPVTALVIGEWGAHRREGFDISIPDAQLWGVTHVPTGGTMTSSGWRVTRAQAIACARALNRRLGRVGGLFGVAQSVSMDDRRIAEATVAEVLAEGSAR